MNHSNSERPQAPRFARCVDMRIEQGLAGCGDRPTAHRFAFVLLAE
jgi:hypothetical protein